MSESEQREIERLAYEWDTNSPNEDSFIMPVRLFRFAKHIATAMAEKKNVEIEYLKTTLNDLRTLSESLQREIKILDEALDKHLK